MTVFEKLAKLKQDQNSIRQYEQIVDPISAECKKEEEIYFQLVAERDQAREEGRFFRTLALDAKVDSQYGKLCKLWDKVTMTRLQAMPLLNKLGGQPLDTEPLTFPTNTETDLELEIEGD